MSAMSSSFVGAKAGGVGDGGTVQAGLVSGAVAEFVKQGTVKSILAGEAFTVGMSLLQNNNGSR